MRLWLALAAAMALAGCSGGREIAPGITAASATDPIAPGSVRFSIQNPDEDRWSARVREGAPDGSVRYGFTCKVLACPEPATVIVVNRRAPPGRPDPKALETIAKDSIPKLAQARNLELQVASNNRAKLENLSSAVTSYGAFPAVLAETRIVVGERERYMAVATVFAGRLLVTINADAADRATARTAVDSFARSFKVEEGPPL